MVMGAPKIMTKNICEMDLGNFHWGVASYTQVFDFSAKSDGSLKGVTSMRSEMLSQRNEIL